MPSNWAATSGRWALAVLVAAWCGLAFAVLTDGTIDEHGEPWEYTARCPQGHVFSGALPG